MLLTQKYQVADHCFSITAPNVMLEQLTNYKPFEVSFPTGIFHLIVEQEIYQEPDVSTLIFVSKSDKDMPRIEVFRVGEDLLLNVSMFQDDPICTHLLINSDYTVGHLWIETPDFRFAIDNATMLLYAFRTASYNTLEMHASVVLKDDFGFLFLGQSGTGKSTHSQLWLKAYVDAELLNDDNPIVRLMDDGQVWVYGSPWSGKTPCYKNLRVQVKAFVKLSQASENRISNLRAPEAYMHILSSSSGLKIEPSMMDSLYRTISAIILKIPVYNLECLPNVDAARLCYETIKD